MQKLHRCLYFKLDALITRKGYGTDIVTMPSPYFEACHIVVAFAIRDEWLMDGGGEEDGE